MIITAITELHTIKAIAIRYYFQTVVANDPVYKYTYPFSKLVYVVGNE